MLKNEPIDEKAVQKDQKIMDFRTFVLADLKKKPRVMNALNVVFQDFYLFLERLAMVGNPEWEKIEAELDKLIAEVGGDVFKVEQGFMNQSKDIAIRRMVIFELMRQYTIFLNKQKEADTVK